MATLPCLPPVGDPVLEGVALFRNHLRPGAACGAVSVVRLDDAGGDGSGPHARELVDPRGDVGMVAIDSGGEIGDCRRSQSSAAVLDFIGRILLGLGETGGAAALTFGEIPLGLSATCSH